MDKSKSELMELKAMMMNRDLREKKYKGSNSKVRDYYPISTILYEVGNSCILASTNGGGGGGGTNGR